MGNYNYNYNYNNYNNNWINRKKENFRPPKSQDNNRRSFGSQLSSWEKKFCATAGVPWQKVLETQKYICQDDKILKWNDTAAKEAFWNAKNRFWAEMHGQPCDIKMPDPNSFVDEIDWESPNVDQDLIWDLEKDELDIPEKHDGGVVIGFPVVQEQYDQYIPSPTGWEDAEEWDPQSKNCPRDYPNGYDNLDSSNEWNGFSARNGADNGQTMYDNKQQSDNGYKNHLFGHKDASWNTSRYKVKRYQHHNHSMLNNYYHGNRRGNFVYDHPLVEWKPVRRGW